MKRILNYPGSKWRLADIIIENMPPHTTYIEPFFGSGAVFFSKEASTVETINDLNERVYNFFKVCREQPEQLAKLVYLTPHSRQEQQLSDKEGGNELENARKFLVQSWQTVGGVQRHKSGWRSNIDKMGGKLHEWNEIPERVLAVAERLKHAQIENQDAVKLLQRYSRKDVFAYVDPPYLLSTRKGRYYETDMEDEQQPELLEVLRDFKGKFILSGYDNELYNDILKDCYKVYINAQAEAGQSRTEVLWMNYEPSGQMTLL
ncbi:DNA adenine methylase [Enterococcus sp. BWR-S5]|uniref:DNA adenine methylase n=1 Tax=Enterococcus sp. BWR-S5 TaxID=2787714 RepID=UPI001920FA21|nr:DNA adenine methylase [Enterococcus sp. BWR-S5]MBL1226593.1 DNA adenine methylase [Enterococcus sp. BWR-S5]